MASMSTHTPTVIVLAGPNGAGKTTAAPRLLRDALGVLEFVNADTIAQGLAGFDPDIAALEAGTVMFDRIRQLGVLGRSFAFETTLASRSLAPWINELIRTGYDFNLVFLWLPSAALAVQRVADRVRLGGHDVPEATVRRRYERGLQNFFRLYHPMATTWRMYDNTDIGNMRLIAEGCRATVTIASDRPLWERIHGEHRHGDQ
jgi:predicted ABC-type ATPase